MTRRMRASWTLVKMCYTDSKHTLDFLESLAVAVSMIETVFFSTLQETYALSSRLPSALAFIIPALD